MYESDWSPHSTFKINVPPAEKPYVTFPAPQATPGIDSHVQTPIEVTRTDPGQSRECAAWTAAAHTPPQTPLGHKVYIRISGTTPTPADAAVAQKADEAGSSGRRSRPVVRLEAGRQGLWLTQQKLPARPGSRKRESLDAYIGPSNNAAPNGDDWTSARSDQPSGRPLPRMLRMVANRQEKRSGTVSGPTGDR